jgi:hypothetical protein
VSHQDTHSTSATVAKRNLNQHDHAIHSSVLLENKSSF